MSIKRLRWLMVVLLQLVSVAPPSAKAEATKSGILPAISGDIVASTGSQVAAGFKDTEVPKHRRKKPVVTPEPGSLLLLGTGIAVLALASLRRKNKMTLV
jgi:hypothetical protein